MAGSEPGSDDADGLAGWPVRLRGVTETVVTTRGPDGRWNVAALGVLAPEGDGPATARTWGETRTRRTFRDRGEGHVQFTRDPATFVEAALSIREVDEPVLPEADAWVRVAVEQVDAGRDGGTDWAEWTLEPVESAVERRVVPTINRGYNAIVEATVAASRLDVPAYDREALVERLAGCERVVERCGGARERAAWERLEALVEWRPE